MATTYRQFHLVNGTGQDFTTQLRCWLEDDARLTVGRRITLKRDGDAMREWVINERSEMTLDRHPTLRWQVGGL